MAKDQTVFLCQSCGADYPRAYGKCPACGAWNSFVEHRVRKQPTAGGALQFASAGKVPRLLKDVDATQEQRIDTSSEELNRVLGGGLVAGSLVLIGGEPGIGKSTLVLQVAIRMRGKRVLYVSGEESERQLKLRAERIGKMESTCYILAETALEEIFTHITNVQPDLVIIDSIQTIAATAADAAMGSISQVRECSAALLQFAKNSNIPIFLIGHITKEGSIAGPKLLEHIVDTVLQFEGDRHYMYRILRAHKNRFGSTDELAIFEMQHDGLREVSNPSELLLSQNNDGLSGIAIAAMIEGVRPFLVEVQALVSTAAYGTPQRSATGFDARRMNMLLAVLEKRAGFKLPQKDVFLNIAGGLRVNDPAVDLAVLAAVLSSNLDIALPRNIALAGEVGLSGEIRPVNRIEQRIAEAERLGFHKIIIPDGNFSKLTGKRHQIEVVGAGKVEEVFRILFGNE